MAPCTVVLLASFVCVLRQEDTPASPEQRWDGRATGRLCLKFLIEQQTRRPLRCFAHALASLRTTGKNCL
ncbi:hypothetical protein E2C01_021588 [Portunus trituberculatus]|uniref:Secreted protein n=1 Tax=Portunus trituberculatus TaxID=210409 RepID=A0A5B7E4S4_PORTR|nr:hypothetical protein [Portunus trituberculatus]